MKPSDLIRGVGVSLSQFQAAALDQLLSIKTSVTPAAVLPQPPAPQPPTFTVPAVLPQPTIIPRLQQRNAEEMRVLELARAGYGCVEISGLTGITQGRIHWICTTNQVKLRRRRAPAVTPELVQRCLALHAEGKSAGEISVITRISETTVRNICNGKHPLNGGGEQATPAE